MLEGKRHFYSTSITNESVKIIHALSSVAKIVFTGPESSGKTTLAQHLSKELNYPWVSEYARNFLTHLNRSYTEADLLDIARGQIAAEDAALAQSPQLLLCDTDLLTIKIWSEVKYGHCHPWIEQQVRERPYQHYLLCAPDLPWEPDPLREHPQDRRTLFVRYVSTLCQLKKPFTVVAGKADQRRATAHAVIKDVLDRQLVKV